MATKIKYFTVLIILGILLILLNIFNQIEIGKLKKTKLLLEKNKIDLQLISEEMKEKVARDYMFRLIKLDSTMSLYKASITNSTKMFEIVKSKQILVLRLSKNDCNNCVGGVLKQLKSISEKIGDNNIAIISDFESPREMGIFMRENDLHNELYSTPPYSFDDEIDKFTPYFFILDQEYIMKDIFFTLHTLEFLNLEYLNIVARKYFNPISSLDNN